MIEDKLTHFDKSGRAVMVDVSEKIDTERIATAVGKIIMNPKTLEMIEKGESAKGDVLCVAQVAGIMAAKRTYDVIPMCHNILLKSVKMFFNILKEENAVEIIATVKCVGSTGVEMEALHAVSVSALTIYDMCKAVDKKMQITNIYLKEKIGGKSGHFIN